MNRSRETLVSLRRCCHERKRRALPRRGSAGAPIDALGQDVRGRERLALTRSSNACRALAGGCGTVSRSTVVRGSKKMYSCFDGVFRRHLARAPASGTRADAPVSKFRHCAHECRSAPHLEQRASSVHAVAVDSSLPHRAHRIASRKPGMLRSAGAIGGWPRGASFLFSGGFC